MSRTRLCKPNAQGRTGCHFRSVRIAESVLRKSLETQKSHLSGTVHAEVAERSTVSFGNSLLFFHGSGAREHRRERLHKSGLHLAVRDRELHCHMLGLLVPTGSIAGAEALTLL
jgi:hypothetical protein